MKRKLIRFKDHLKESLKEAKFKKAWEESELEYQVARMLIGQRVKNKISQKELARKANTTQAVISRLETMNANPSLALLEKIAKALDTKLVVQFRV